MLVDLLNEVMKLIQGSGLVEMDQLVLDPFWHGCKGNSKSSPDLVC
jgi:hypothetical protein